VTIFEAAAISKSFGQIAALTEVSFHVRAGVDWRAAFCSTFFEDC